MPEASPIPAAVGERIRRHRTRWGLTQEELGQLASINASQLGKYERGVNDPSVTTLVRLAGALGVDLGELIRGIGRDLLPAAEQSLQTAEEFLAERERNGGKQTRRGRNRR